jgi:acyl carrier protein
MLDTKPIADRQGADLLNEVTLLVIETVNLEINPADIDPDQPIFREGLGLDSIDALEIALAISQRYGFQLRSDDDNNKKIFASLRSLAEHIKTNRNR